MNRLFGSFICVFLFTLSFVLTAQAADPGRLERSIDNPAVYYVLDTGRRFAFPNEAIFHSWFPSFESVATVTPFALAQAQLAGSVFFHPGTLVKVTTDPKVYLVVQGGQLRWIETEAVARAAFGPTWALQIHDLSDALFSPYSISTPIDALVDLPVTNQTLSIAENQIQTAVPLSPAPLSSLMPAAPSSCQTFSCQFPITPQRYDIPGEVSTSNVGSGRTLALGNNLYIRNEGIVNQLLHYSVWNKTAFGCRIIHNMMVPTDGAAARPDAGGIFGDLYTRIHSSPTNELVVEKSSGTLGFSRCMEDAATNHDEDSVIQCRLLPHPGAWIFRDGTDERIFDQTEWDQRNYVQYSLTAQKKILARIRQTFPAFLNAVPNMSLLRGVLRQPTGLSGAAHPAGFYFTTNPRMSTVADQELVRWNALSEDSKNGVETMTNAEGHEPWHVLLSSTQLTRWIYAPAGDQMHTETMLREGVAEYLRGPSDPGYAASLKEWCKDTRLEDTWNHRSIAYTDPSIDPYVKGICFFTRIEQVCGLPAMNQVFRMVLKQAYEPNASYPHFFGLVDSTCSDHVAYRQLLANFGYGTDVLSLRRSLIPSFPLSSDNACVD